MSVPSFTVTSPLTMRLLRRLLLLSVALILIIAGLRAAWEYRQKLAEADQHLSTIKSAELKSLANSLWEVNTEQLALQLEGMINIPGINYAAVVDEDKVVVERGQSKTKDVLVHEAALVRQHD